MRKDLVVAVGAALLVVGAHFVMGPKRPAAVTGEFQRYRAEEVAVGLDRVIPEVRFDHVPFEQAMDSLARAGKARIVVDWRGIAGLDFATDWHGSLFIQSVSVRLRNIPLSRAIEMISGASYPGLRCSAVGASIHVGPADPGTPVARIYDVDDLLEESAGLNGQFFLPGGSPVPASALPRAGCFPSPTGPIAPSPKARDTAGAALEEILAGSVGRDWDGVEKRIHYWSGRVLVVHTQGTQKRIQQTLALLRMQRPGETGPAADPLNRSIGPVRFEKRPVGEVLCGLLEMSGVDFVVNWWGLGGAGREMTLRTDEPVSLGTLLRQVLSKCDREWATGWWVEDGVVVVAARGWMGGTAAMRIYDVRDLIAEIVCVEGPLPGGLGWPSTAVTAQEAGDQLTAFLVEAVSPEVWRAKGGPGVLRHFAGRFVIVAGPKQHQEVEELLSRLRTAVREGATADDRAWARTVRQWER